MEEIDEDKKQKMEILAIKEFIMEQKHDIREIKNIMNFLGEIKAGETEKFRKSGQPDAAQTACSI